MMELLQRFDMNVQDFLANHAAIGTAVTTITNYRLRLGYFRAFLAAMFANDGENAEKQVIVACDVKKWRDSMLAEGRKPGTVRQYLVELKVFFNYVCDPDMGCEPITEKNPDGSYRNPVSDRLYPRITEADRMYDHVMSDDALEILWKNQCPKGNPRIAETWARNYAIVVLLLDSKIRNAELLSLKLSDVDFSRREIKIRRGKGNKFRMVSISEISLSAIRLYLASGIRPDYVTDDDYLFGTEAAKGTFGNGNAGEKQKWHRGTTQWLSQLVERHVRNVTGQEGFRTHSLRHAGAALDLNAGERLERIQAELGHSSVRTTERYTDRLRSVSDAYRSEEIIQKRNEWAEFNNNLLCTVV